MKKTALALISLMLLAVLAGCSSIPGCDAAAVRDEVIRSSKELFRKSFQEAGADPAAVDRLSFSLSGMRESGQAMSSRSCVASLTLEGPNSTKSMPVSYTVGASRGGAPSVEVSLSPR